MRELGPGPGPGPWLGSSECHKGSSLPLAATRRRPAARGMIPVGVHVPARPERAPNVRRPPRPASGHLSVGRGPFRAVSAWGAASYPRPLVLAVEHEAPAEWLFP